MITSGVPQKPGGSSVECDVPEIADCVEVPVPLNEPDPSSRQFSSSASARIPCHVTFVKASNVASARADLPTEKAATFPANMPVPMIQLVVTVTLALVPLIAP